MAEDIGGGGGGGGVMKEYRRGNWTLSETMVLIEAKQMDDERRLKRSESSTDQSSAAARAAGITKPAELRWKWVEDYCWRKGCLRSQNQCNDKWDNLMRDYKKVRDYEKSNKSPGAQPQQLSYWKMEKNERKEKNLPSNMLLQIYEALVEVVEKKGSGQRVIAPTAAVFEMERQPMICCSMVQPTPLLRPNIMAQQLSSATPVLPLPPPPPLPSQQAMQFAVPALICGSSDSDTSEYSADTSSPAKRRRRQRHIQVQGGNIASGDQQQQQGTGTGGGGGTATAATASGSSSQELLGTAISKGASVIAEALHACEERQERRHRDLVGLHERRLKIEESKSEVNRQGIDGLVDAINKLANSIFALASTSTNTSKNQQSTPK